MKVGGNARRLFFFPWKDMWNRKEMPPMPICVFRCGNCLDAEQKTGFLFRRTPFLLPLSGGYGKIVKVCFRD